MVIWRAELFRVCTFGVASYRNGKRRVCMVSVGTRWQFSSTRQSTHLVIVGEIVHKWHSIRLD
jgi:hypothetical protein